MTIFRKVLERLQKWKLDHDGIRTNTAQKMADRHEQLEDQVKEISTRLLEDTVEAQEIICNEVTNEDFLKNDTTEDRKRFIETVNSRLERYMENEEDLKTNTLLEEEDACENMDNRTAFVNAVKSRLETILSGEILRSGRESDALFDSGYSSGYSSGEDSNDSEIADAEVALRKDVIE